MSYRKISCGKCGAVIANSNFAITVKNPDNSRYGMLVDVCGSCNTSKDLQQVLTDRLYPKDSANEQVVLAMNDEKERAARYQKSKEEWIAANPGASFPDGHS